MSRAIWDLAICARVGCPFDAEPASRLAARPPVPRGPRHRLRHAWGRAVLGKTPQV